MSSLIGTSVNSVIIDEFVKRGFTILAQNSGDVDYVRMAYGLALSLRLTQEQRPNICLITGKQPPQDIANMFDHIVLLETDDAEDSEWKIENKWQWYYLTPYHETIFFDADMLVLSDLNQWWHACWNNSGRRSHVVPTFDVETYRGEVVTSNYYRKTFTENNLPNVYTGVFYLRKSLNSLEYFKTVELIYKDWEKYYREFLPNATPTHVSGDVVFALAFEMMEWHVTDVNLTFTHMKPHCQNWGKPHSDNWLETLQVSYDGNLYVGNYRQQGVFHYVEKDFLTDEILQQLKNEYGLRILQGE